MKSVEVLISRPHNYGVSPSQPRGVGVEGYNPDNLWYQEFELSVHIPSGLTVRQHLSPQLNLGLPFPLNHVTNNLLGVNVFPIYWQDAFDSISTHNADQILDGIRTANGLSLGFYVGVTLFGVILVAVGVLILVMSRRMGDRGQDVPLST